MLVGLSLAAVDEDDYEFQNVSEDVLSAHDIENGLGYADANHHSEEKEYVEYGFIRKRAKVRLGAYRFLT